MKPVRLRLEAEIELFEATLWYETEREGLGFEFDAEIHQTLTRISEGPQQFPELKRGIRRALVDRFPYGVFFVEVGDEISVIGVIHLHRDPKTWRTR